MTLFALPVLRLRFTGVTLPILLLWTRTYGCMIWLFVLYLHPDLLSPAQHVHFSFTASLKRFALIPRTWTPFPNERVHCGDCCFSVKEICSWLSRSRENANKRTSQRVSTMTFLFITLSHLYWHTCNRSLFLFLQH